MVSNNDKLLYIGLNGLAGSGKDTVAKMLNVILMKNWSDFDSCRNFYNNFYNKPNASASYYEKYKGQSDQVLCIAFADQLKTICADIFGIDLRCFYFNKSTAWICINKGFEYTEIRPDNVISCEEYFYNISSYKDSDTKYWMSLRDILVYIGTYVLQQDLNRQVFVNTVSNKIKASNLANHNLKYVIVTDVRFQHEFDYIRNNNGITIKITRNGIVQLENIAEHDLDEEDRYDFIVENNDGYDELFQQIWDLVYKNQEFQNNIIELNTRENVNNYLRQLSDDCYKVCSPFGIQQINHNSSGDICMIDLKGGPTIDLGVEIPGTDLIPSRIEMDDDNKFLIYI